jgi:decaprenylphospho-beta-D-erythro-pentofuranosid-2-ulose 2-reductase
MVTMQRILIVGATSLIAEHCARRWVQRPSQLVLAGRDAERLERIAGDLRIRGPQSTVETVTPDFEDPAAITAFVDAVWQKSPIDVALVAHGSLPDQTECRASLKLVHEALSTNAISPVMFAEALASHMQSAGRGTIAVIGSVAGDRGRRSNYIYGAAKGLVDRYMQGLRHRFTGSTVKAIIIKPGPTDTPMTAGMRRGGIRFADPADVARDIVRGIDSGQRVIYTPWIWRWVMMIIRHIPDRLFGILNF